MESGGTLDSILSILRSEGFYAAEAALRREIEDRYEIEEFNELRSLGESAQRNSVSTKERHLSTENNIDQDSEDNGRVNSDKSGLQNYAEKGSHAR